MSVSELKQRHIAATETVNSLRQRLNQKRLQLLDTDSMFFSISNFYSQCCCFNFTMSCVVAGYAKSLGKSPVAFGPTDLVCCRTLQGHTGKVSFRISVNHLSPSLFKLKLAIRVVAIDCDNLFF
ncbi:hypothetical protein HanRHA438_Chr04g0201151 [Helianthus annuus]|nr:putative guanine nucleotide-binding protein, beta subunit [Helianthus annuus]KAJ0763125.1 putative guanine nucleotide-binding protein, beta subunit [Helianthus annuus]KAJ0929093.1 hypothetical protein HanRHA438_Chr04g0201151 [Helianthus annuus]